jgi:hypothetical protein
LGAGDKAGLLSFLGAVAGLEFVAEGRAAVLAGAFDDTFDLEAEAFPAPAPEDFDAEADALGGAGLEAGLPLTAVLEAAALVFWAAGFALGLPVDFAGFLVVFFAMKECETDT